MRKLIIIIYTKINYKNFVRHRSGVICVVDFASWIFANVLRLCCAYDNVLAAYGEPVVIQQNNHDLST